MGASGPYELPLALTGELRALDGVAGRLAYYAPRGTPPAEVPLLLVHSLNAAATSYEMKPLYEHYAPRRPVYALELPGFGFSERSDRPYSPRLMTDAVLAMVAEIRRLHGDAPFDAIALSLSAEFLARAAVEAPGVFRSVGLVSPTGFDKRGARPGPPGSTRAIPWLHAAFTVPLWRRPFYDLLTSRPSIRFFLRKTWGAKEIDEDLLAYDYLTARQPGAEHAPFYFVSGYLFSRDIGQIYESLALPVWMAHGVRGDFVDYSRKTVVASKPNWTIDVFDTGALPQFERLDDLVARYERFRAALPAA
jgi:pimeloyl-ACP methyl ester carboxylesterase